MRDMLQEWTQHILKANGDYPMKKTIRRVKPPAYKSKWLAEFRRTATGVTIDLTVTVPIDEIRFTMHKTSYLMPMKVIKAWAKGPSYNDHSFSGHLQ